MKRLYILCEGQTEEDFISIVFNPYLQNIGITAIPIICTTKRTPTKKYKGGVSTYSKIKKELQKLCGEHPNEMVTTMFDYYGLPDDTPGIGSNINNIYERAKHIEIAIMNDIGSKFSNLFFNIVLHEFEGLLFSDLLAFNDIIDSDAISFLHGVKDKFDTPEHINDSPETAPYKRIKEVIPGYSKVVDGIDIASQIGIAKISVECKHFGAWVAKIVALSDGVC